jgi:Uma2 family endonuclease
MVQVLAKEKTDQRVTFNGTWEQFRLIQEAIQGSPGVRLSFFANEIEILMPGFEHENFAEIIGYLVTTYLLVQGIRFHPSGSMTQEKEGKASTQADKSFCLDEPKPIPDLSIEVVYTSGGLSKLQKYQALGVPEVWFWEAGSLRLYHLRDQTYESISTSQLPGLADLNLDLLQRCVLISKTDFAAGVQAFQVAISKP